MQIRWQVPRAQRRRQISGRWAGQVLSETLKSAKGKQQQLGPQWSDEAAQHGEEKAARPPVSAPQSRCEWTICLRSQACPNPPSPLPHPLCPLLSAGPWEEGGVAASWKVVKGGGMESGFRTPGPCLPLPIKAPCLRAQP